MSSIKRIAFGISTAALAAGTVIAAPSIAMAATSPAASVTTVSDSAVTPYAYTWYGTYGTKSGCNAAGYALLYEGNIHDFHCDGTPYGPGGSDIHYDLWVI